MKTIHSLVVVTTTLSALLLSGCAGDNMFGGPTTAALPEKPKVNPVCVSLASQIDALRRDGVADRVAAASQGKTATVNMKRDSLAKVAELNKANAEFQAKCGTVAPSTAAQSISAPPAAATPAVAKAVSSAPAKAVAKTVAAAAPKAPAVPAAPAAAETVVVKQAVEAVKPKAE